MTLEDGKAHRVVLRSALALGGQVLHWIWPGIVRGYLSALAQCVEDLNEYFDSSSSLENCGVYSEVEPQAIDVLHAGIGRSYSRRSLFSMS